MTPAFLRPIVRATALAAVLALAGCSAVTSGAYVNTRVGLARYATVTWVQPPNTPTGDPRLDNSPFFADRVRDGVLRGLAARGYATAESGGELQAHFHANMTQEIDATQLDQQFCAEGGCRPDVYEIGTLVVDLIDPATGTLVWRGWAESTLGELVDDQAAFERRVDLSVAQILARLPDRR